MIFLICLQGILQSTAHVYDFLCLLLLLYLLPWNTARGMEEVAMGQLESLTATRAALWLRILFDGFGMPSAFYSANEAKRPQHDTTRSEVRWQPCLALQQALSPSSMRFAGHWLAVRGWGGQKGLGRHVACKLLYSRTHTHAPNVGAWCLHPQLVTVRALS